MNEQGLRQLTEAEAWETLARYFRGAVRTEPKTERRLYWHDVAGLCFKIEDLKDGYLIFPHPMISYATAGEMLARVNAPKAKFLWPRTREGAIQRAAFAEAQVKRCRKEVSK